MANLDYIVSIDHHAGVCYVKPDALLLKQLNRWMTKTSPMHQKVLTGIWDAQKKAYKGIGRTTFNQAVSILKYYIAGMGEPDKGLLLEALAEAELIEQKCASEMKAASRDEARGNVRFVKTIGKRRKFLNG